MQRPQSNTLNTTTQKLFKNHKQTNKQTNRQQQKTNQNIQVRTEQHNMNILFTFSNTSKLFRTTFSVFEDVMTP